MSDKQLAEEFGLSLDAVERIVSKVESGDLADFDTSKVMDGQPMERVVDGDDSAQDSTSRNRTE